MKVEKKANCKGLIRLNGGELKLFGYIQEIGFYPKDGCPFFGMTLEELKQLLPHLQRAVNHNELELPPKYEVVPMDTMFAVKRLCDGKYYMGLDIENKHEFDSYRPCLFNLKHAAKKVVESIELGDQE